MFKSKESVKLVLVVRRKLRKSFGKIFKCFSPLIEFLNKI